MPSLTAFLSEPYTLASRISPSTELALSLLTSDKDARHTSRQASPQLEKTDAIVIVGVDPDLRAYVRFGLETHGPAGLCLIEAHSPAPALTLLQRGHAQLVIVDADEAGVPAELTQQCAHHRVPLLLLAGDDHPFVSDSSVHLSTLRTPFNGRMLWAHVHALLNTT